MSFVEIIKGLVAGVPGGVAALLMGYDGIPLAEYKVDPNLAVDLQVLAVEYTGLVNEMRKNATNLGTEGLEEVNIKTGQWSVLIRLVNEEYFLILLLSSPAYFGKGRYLLRGACTQVKSEL